jgi:hypothetical protein
MKKTQTALKVEEIHVPEKSTMSRKSKWLTPHIPIYKPVEKPRQSSTS